MRKIRNPENLTVDVVAKTAKGVIHGNAVQSIKGICPVDQPVAGCITFLSGAVSAKVLALLSSKGVSVAFALDSEFSKAEVELPSGFCLITVAEPFLATVSIIPFFYEKLSPADGISAKAEVDPTASIGEQVKIGPFCYVGADVVIEDGVELFAHVTIYDGATIGKGSVLHSGVVIREDCKIGPESVLQNGAIVGADGFGYRPDPVKGLVAFPQVGIVDLAPRVDIGANACVDRGALGDTVVGLGSKIDNLVQVGHNTKIGSHSVLCGQVGVSGSCTIGDQVTLAGGVGVADHVTIASNTRFGARSGITGSVTEAGDYAGWPVIKASKWRRQAASLRSLPELVKEMRTALKRLEN